MRVGEDVFQIQEKGEHYIYVPLANRRYGRFLQIGEDVVRLLEDVSNGRRVSDRSLVGKLRRRNILVSSRNRTQEQIPKLEEAVEFCPTATTLLPTTACNLRCVYCYSNAGEVSVKNMRFGTAKKAVDFISANTFRKEGDYFDLCFHGGGEPFVAWPLMRKVVSYAQSRTRDLGIKTKVTICSNGVLRREQLEWILGNKISLSLSLDGPEDIQNTQRPMRGGGPTFERVLKTIKFLEKHGLDYGIRATITNNSVSRLSELVNFFCSVAPSAVGYALEPLNQCGRCVKTDTSAIDMDRFAEEFIRAKSSVNPRDGRKVHYSGARLDSVVLNFCGASGKNFFITPEGYVTACLEVLDVSDPKSGTFFYGKESEHGFEFDEGRLRTLSSINVGNIPNCQNCFAKYSCAGDCPSRSSNNGNVFDTSKNPRCVANRKILLDYLKGGVSKDGK